jgi:DNA-binding MurR/RpiR family transcriptional regulator
MSWNDKDKQRMYIGELQGLQRQINFLKKANEDAKEPSIENAIDILRNSQDKLYSALAQHGITAEDVHRVIIENNDNAVVKEVMRLQHAKNTLKKQLTDSKLTPEKRQLLETRLARKSQQHTAQWDEIINSPDKDRIINKIEQAQIKQLQKEQARDRTREPEGRSR